MDSVAGRQPLLSLTSQALSEQDLQAEAAQGTPYRRSRGLQTDLANHQLLLSLSLAGPCPTPDPGASTAALPLLQPQRAE